MSNGPAPVRSAVDGRPSPFDEGNGIDQHRAMSSLLSRLSRAAMRKPRWRTPWNIVATGLAWLLSRLSGLSRWLLNRHDCLVAAAFLGAGLAVDIWGLRSERR